MQGYETKQQRDAHVKALAVELRDVRRAIGVAKEKLEEVPDDKRLERVARELELGNLEERVGLIEDQLRAFKGDAPHKRAQTRKQQGAETR